MGRPPSASLALLLALAGCHGASLEERRASLALIRGSSLGGGERPATFAWERVALVCAEGWREADGSGRFRVCATAAAVTTDGYFLTAAHVAETCRRLTRVAHRLVPNPDDLVPLRVVWSGRERDPPCDLALVHAEGVTGAAFALAPADAAPVGTTLVCAGFPEGRFLIAAGRVTSSEVLPGDQPPVRELRHDAPLREGDSGGPAFDLAGRLIGIDWGAVLELAGGWRGGALPRARPGLAGGPDRAGPA